jgi:FixJ family two-component response regulator
MISIVDDDASFRQSTASLVRSLGYVATAFASAEEFLKSGLVEETSCLISDVQMPGMSGIELHNRLIAQGHRLPVIFITAFPETRARRQTLAVEAVGFLGKPLNEDELISCIDQALVGRNA